MPHTRSAKKNMRKADKRRIANKVAKKAIKKQIKTFVAAVEGPLDALRTAVSLAAAHDPDARSSDDAATLRKAYRLMTLVPEIVATPIVAGSEGFLSWIEEETLRP